MNLFDCPVNPAQLMISIRPAATEDAAIALLRPAVAPPELTGGATGAGVVAPLP